MNMLRPALITLALLPVLGSAIAGAAGNQPGSARQAQIKQMLQQTCTVCHGPTLKGDVGPALTAEALAAKDEQTLVTTILEGRTGTVMPSWESFFKESEARWLVQFLRKGKPE